MNPELTEGGAGSGNFGHHGRPGHVGGSTAGGGGGGGESQIEITRTAREIAKRYGTTADEIAAGYAVPAGYVMKLTVGGLDDKVIINAAITTKDGKDVGYFARDINMKSKTVEHVSFSLGKDYQGQGIATHLNEKSFDMYRKIGMESVTLTADGDVGKYAWAAQGFDFANPGRAKFERDELKRFVSDKSGGLIRFAGTNTLYGRQWDEISKSIDKLEHAWDFARFQINGRKIGKEFLLDDEMGEWNGVMSLDGSSVHQKVWSIYVDVQKAKKPQLREALTEGGAGSGNWGHHGRPGHVGGSTAGGGGGGGSHIEFAVGGLGGALTTGDEARVALDSFLKERHSSVDELINAYTLQHTEFHVSSLNIQLSEEKVLFIDGEISTKSGAQVAEFERRIYFEADDDGVSNYARHHRFDVDRASQGKGIATALNEKSISYYRKIGLSHVVTDADGSVGKYAWAMQGFDFANESDVREFRRGFVNHLYNSKHAIDQDAGEKIAESLSHSWDFARFKIGDEKVGKEFLLSNRDWEGKLSLDESSINQKVWSTYLGVQKSKKPQLRESSAIGLQEGKTFGRSDIEAPGRESITAANFVLGGVEKNKQVAATAIAEYDAYKDELEGTLNSMLDQYENREITAGQLAFRLKETIRIAYTKAFELGMLSEGWTGGLEPADHKWLQTAYREEWSYLNKFMDTLRQDRLIMAAKDRLGMYRDTVDSMFWAGKVEGSPGPSLIHWKLRIAEHCQNCLDLAAGSPYTRATLPTTPKAGDTACLSNCRCYLEIEPDPGAVAGGTIPPTQTPGTQVPTPGSIAVPEGLVLPTPEQQAVVDALAVKAAFLRESAAATSGPFTDRIRAERDTAAKELVQYLKANKLHLKSKWALDGMVRSSPVTEEQRSSIIGSSIGLGALAMLSRRKKKEFGDLNEQLVSCIEKKTI